MYFDYRRYPYRRPPELAGERPVHEVAIVGAGPIGLTLALGLARRGVKLVLFEDEETVNYGSRATCISRRSLEILDRLGVAERMLGKALAWTGGRSFYRDKLVLEFAMAHEAALKHPPMVNLQQCYAEQYLVDELQAFPNVEIRWGSKLTGLETDDDGVSLAIETPDGPYRAQAQWAVACDGARSAVRQALGLKMTGTSYEGRYVIVDIKLETDHPVERRAWFDPPSNPGATILMHCQPDAIWRVDYQLRDDEDPEDAVKPENVIPRVRAHLDWIGERHDWAVEWISLYKAHSLTLAEYRHHRVLLAGDAAHLVPIFGVRGMNSGLDDANNLAWKLAYVLRNRSGIALLDSYSQERVAAARENIRHADKSTMFMTPPSRGHALMQAAALSLAVTQPFVRTLINPRQSAPVGFPDSMLNTTTPRGDDFEAGPAPGFTCPNLAVGGHGHLLDAFGDDFTALVFLETAQGVAPARALAGAGPGSIPVTVVAVTDAAVTDAAVADAAVTDAAVADAALQCEGVTLLRDPARRLFERFDAAHGTVYLIRPDGHVAARWRAADGPTLRQAVDRAAAVSARERAA